MRGDVRRGEPGVGDLHGGGQLSHDRRTELRLAVLELAQRTLAERGLGVQALGESGDGQVGEDACRSEATAQLFLRRQLRHWGV